MNITLTFPQQIAVYRQLKNVFMSHNLETLVNKLKKEDCYNQLTFCQAYRLVFNCSLKEANNKWHEINLKS